MKRKRKSAASLFANKFNMEALPIYEELVRENPGVVDAVSCPNKNRAKVAVYLSTHSVPSLPAITPAN
jgi:hypothetical protein